MESFLFVFLGWHFNVGYSTYVFFILLIIIWRIYFEFYYTRPTIWVGKVHWFFFLISFPCCKIRRMRRRKPTRWRRSRFYLKQQRMRLGRSLERNWKKLASEWSGKKFCSTIKSIRYGSGMDFQNQFCFYQSNSRTK